MQFNLELERMILLDCQEKERSAFLLNTEHKVPHSPTYFHLLFCDCHV